MTADPAGSRTEPERIADHPAGPESLLARLELTEKIAMLHQRSPSVGRLGLDAFRTGTEALHGVAWLGTATVFPQPVGLAATWDPALVREIGDAVATEVRAKHAAQPSVSLNVWAPVVNPLRHPRWGRNEEGFSEDPDLTAELATAYAQGLRGRDPVVWKTVPTVKHVLGYGNETDRTVTSSHLPPQALRDYELPAFEGPLRSGSVGAAMPSYNLVNGRPSHVSGELLRELRCWAPVPLTVVSDAQAPSNLVDDQRYFGDHVSAHAAALLAGVDSFTDNDEDAGPTAERITSALASGLITEADIDAAVLRLLRLRELTGELTHRDPYRIPPTAVDTADHRALAREAAGRSVVLLANDGGALPLRQPRSIAVVGPYADRVATDWYSGTPAYTRSIAAAVAERYPDARVTTVSGADRIALRSASTGRYLRVTSDGAAVVSDALEPGDDSLFEVTEWGDGVLTLRSVSSGRLLTSSWTRVSADAERVGGWVVQQSFRARGNDDGSTSVQHLGSGAWLRVQHGGAHLVADANGAAAERFRLRVVTSGIAEVSAACADADTVIVAVGNEPHLLGRETEDRPHLDLPAASREIWAAAGASGGSRVLVIVSSYPYAIGDEAGSADAVVWSAHAGQELGGGIVDVLSGDREPSGRLPQTWWARADDAGDLFEYDVVQHAMTYRYATATPLFGLGHGLGFSSVEYQGIDLRPGRIDAPGATGRHTPARFTDGAAETDADGDGLLATVTVRNTGDRVAHELVAVYALAPELPVPAPRVRLAGYTRVALRPGERREVAVRCPVGVLAVWDVGAEAADAASGPVGTPGAYRVQPGTYQLATGPSAAALVARAELRVVGRTPAPRRLAELAAHGFHASSSVTTSDLTREQGSCIEVDAAARRGWVRYDNLDLSGRTRLRLTVARRSLPGTVGASIEFMARPASSRDASWTPVVRPVDVPEGLARYTWAELTVPVEPAPALTGPVDLRVLLTGAARLASLAWR